MELAQHRPAYADLAIKFIEHFLWIASAMIHAGEDTGLMFIFTLVETGGKEGSPVLTIPTQ